MKHSKKIIALVLLAVSLFLVALPALAADGSYIPYFNDRTLKRGHTGEDVANLQLALTWLGCDPGPIDGIFGSQTEDAVITFQVRYPDLDVDGQAGRYTKSKIWPLIPNSLVEIMIEVP